MIVTVKIRAATFKVKPSLNVLDSFLRTVIKLVFNQVSTEVKCSFHSFSSSYINSDKKAPIFFNCFKSYLLRY